MSEPLSILVVGGNGFIGGHIIDYLLEKEPQARVESLGRKRAGSYIHKNVKQHHADLADFDAVAEIVRSSKPNVIIHTASPPPFICPDSEYENTNIKGTRNLLHAAAEVDSVRCYVYTSSGSVVHDGASDLLRVDESAPVLLAPQQKEPYWHSKAVAELEILKSNRTLKPNFVSTALRVTSVFGERDPQIMGSQIARAKAGQLNTQIGDGQNLNDWTYVGNIAHAHYLAMRALLEASESSESLVPLESRVEGEAFFITNDEPWLFWGFTRHVAAVAGYPVDEKEVKQLPRFMAWLIGYVSEWKAWITSFGQQKALISRRRMCFCVINQVFNIDKAKKRLGYRPLWGIDEAIRRSVTSMMESERDSSQS